MIKKIFNLICLVMLLQIAFIDVVFASTKYGSSGYTKSAIYPSSIKIKKDFSSVYNLGQEYKLNVEFYPSNTTEKDITWISGDKSILTIDQNGTLIAKKRGTVKVTAKTVNGKSDSITISVIGSNSTSGTLKTIKSMSITNNPKKMLTGETIKLIIQTSPQTDVLKSFTFKSSNEKVLKVDNDGVVSAVGQGKATITVKSSNNKEAKATIEVSDYNIKLSSNSIKGNEGDVKEITATIESKNPINSSNVKWSVTSTNTASVKSISNSSNVFKAQVSLKKSGKTSVLIKIGNSSKEVPVKVLKVGIDTSLNCPNIIYNTSDPNNIKIDITPSNSIVSYDIYISGNKKTGSNATWINYQKDLKGKNTYTFPYTSAQAKITVFDKNGKSRNCFTAPFDMDTSKNSKTQVSYTNEKICPTITETKLDKVDNGNIYVSKNYGYSDTLKIGVKNAYIRVNVDSNRKYQYTWVVSDGKLNIGDICDSNGCGIWNISETFDQHQNKDFVLKPKDDYYNDLQGMVLIIDTQGNVQPCFTNIYNSIAFNKKEVINNTNVYFEKDYEQDINKIISTIKAVPDYYMSSSNLFFIKGSTFEKKFNKNNCGVFQYNGLRIYYNGDNNSCGQDWYQRTIIHEMGHSLDTIYSLMNNSNRISEQNDVRTLFNNHSSSLRDYAYTNIYEYWAELFATDYVYNSSSFQNVYYKKTWSLDNNSKRILDKYENEIKKTYQNNKTKWNEIKKKYQ